MREFHIEVEIQARPETVWGIMYDVERWPEWTPSVTSVRLAGGGPPRVGSRATIRQPKLPPARWVVTELDEPGRRFTWVSRAPGVRVIAEHWVEARGDGSRATLSLRFAGVLGGVLGHLTRGINERYLAMEAQGLKRRSESLGS